MQKLKDWMLMEGWITLLECALVAALAVTLAHWTWVVFTPRAAAAPSASFEAEGIRPGALAQRNVFGASRDAGAAGEASAVSNSRLRVLGVFASRKPGAGRAILSLDNGKPTSVAAGQAIADGLLLDQVHPDHVIVLRGGATERIDLDRRAPAAAARTAAPRPAPK